MVEATFLFRVALTIFVSHFRGYFKVKNAVVYMVNKHGLFQYSKKKCMISKNGNFFFFFIAFSHIETEKENKSEPF